MKRAELRIQEAISLRHLRSMYLAPSCRQRQQRLETYPNPDFSASQLSGRGKWLLRGLRKTTKHFADSRSLKPTFESNKFQTCGNLHGSCTQECLKAGCVALKAVGDGHSLLQSRTPHPLHQVDWSAHTLPWHHRALWSRIPNNDKWQAGFKT